MSTNNLSNINTPWFGISMALLGVVVGVGFMSLTSASPAQVAKNDPAPAAAPTPAAAPAPTPAGDITPPSDDDHIRGDEDATISLVEYSDFECPFCQRHHPTMQALIDNNDDVNWVYRHYPLSFHPNAQPAAEASECAAEQGKFWEMADLLIANSAVAQHSVYAEQIGLDVDEFEDCVSSGKYTQEVKDDMADGSAGGVRGTPGTIVYNNKTGESELVSGAQGEAAFQAAIDRLLQ